MSGSPRSDARRAPALIVTLLASLALLVADTALLAPRADAIDGAELSADVVYRLDAARPAIDVEATYRMTNVSPDRDLGDGRIRYFFFTGLSVPVDEGASDIAVTVDGRPGDFTVETDELGFSYLDIDFRDQLRYRETADVVVTYSILGDPPRADDSQVRVNPAYVSFPVHGFGDPGAVDIQVVLPRGWDTTLIGDELELTESGDVAVYRSSEIERPDDFFVFFTARNDDRLDTTAFTVGDHRFEVASWPDDDEWLAFATEHIRDGVPALEAIIGADWPVGETTTITEATTSLFEGYAGFYDSSLDAIEIGEALDEHTLLHELSHAWFNFARLGDRFIVEGLAEETSARAVEDLDGRLPPLRTDDEIAADWGEVEAFPLLDWPDPWQSEPDEPTEDYGYTASHRVIRALWDEVGDDRMRALLSAVVEGHRAYQPDDGVLRYPGPVGWREFLDLAEQIAGSDALTRVYDELVLDGAARRELGPRAAAIETYDEFVRRSDGWGPPEWVRASMARWQFDDAARRIDDAGRALDTRDLLTAELDALDLTPSDDLEAAYQSIDDDRLEAVLAEFESRHAAAIDLAAAHARLAAALTVIELDVPGLDQADYLADPYLLVDTTEALAVDAEALVALDAELDRLLAEHGLVVPALAPSAFVDDHDAARSLVADRIEAAEGVIDARSARDDADSFFDRVGLIGSDIDDDIARLADDLAAGELDGVSTRSADLVTEASDLDDVGRRRVVLAALAVGGLVAIGIVLVRWRRRRPDRTGVEDPPLAEGVGSSVLANVDDDGAAGDAAAEADAGEAGASDPGTG